MDDILVPPFQYKNIKERKTSHDCPTYVLRLRYVGNNPYRCNKSLPTITLTNKFLTCFKPKRTVSRNRAVMKVILTIMSLWSVWLQHHTVPVSC